MPFYRTNKNKFYIRAAIYLGKGKTRKQVCNKLQNLITKYMSKSANKTGKSASTWSFYTEMNDIFRNHKNVNPNYLINSMGQIYGTSLEQKSNKSKENFLKSNKKQCLNEDEMHYIKSMDTIMESKQIEAETRKKLYDLEKYKFEYE
ncbi:hypothetical protein F8M41_023435 [Gigaspora margarita]|uniref:Uncharacterized protein n=1 Tax=Gigaspora margarita TaxID=4874 RepID=A0A8H4EHF9_GIGMA|nr:hypothetical protein F8M41_023435 [Gigaspora margarita]